MSLTWEQPSLTHMLRIIASYMVISDHAHIFNTYSCAFVYVATTYAEFSCCQLKSSLHLYTREADLVFLHDSSQLWLECMPKVSYSVILVLPEVWYLLCHETVESKNKQQSSADGGNDEAQLVQVSYWTSLRGFYWVHSITFCGKET